MLLLLLLNVCLSRSRYETTRNQLLQISWEDCPTYLQKVSLIHILTYVQWYFIIIDPINDEHWAWDLKKTYKYLKIIDEHKYIYPRFSEILQPFVYFVSQRFVRFIDPLIYSRAYCKVVGNLPQRANLQKR